MKFFVDKQNNEKENIFVEKATWFFKLVIIVIAVLLLICLVIAPYFVEFNGMQQNSICNKWDAKWTERDVTKEELDFIKAKGVDLSGRYVTMASAKLPEDSKYHTYLLLSIIYSDVWFYVGEESFDMDELRYEFYPESETRFAKTGYSVRRTIPLHDGDGDKYITFIQVADSKENFINNKEITYGDKYGLFTNYVSENYITFVMNLTLIVLSVVAVIIVFGIAIILKKNIPEIYMIIGIFFLSIWIVTNSFTVELFFENWHLMNDMLYISDLVNPTAMLLYLDYVQEHRYRKIYFTLEIIFIPLCLLEIILYITNVCGLHDFYMNTIVLFIAQIACIFITIVIDIINKKTAKYRNILIGFAVAAVFILVQIVSYLFNKGDVTIAYMSFGIIILLLFCIVEVAQVVFKSFIEKSAAISASKAKSDVLAQMSHEIRTPINAILGMNEMILRTTSDMQSKQYAEDIKRATDNLLEIVNEILDFSKIDSGKMELQCAEYNLAELIKDVVNMFTVRAKDKKLDFIANIDESLPAYLYGDDVKIRQILANLLSNAVKYTLDGSIELDIKGIEEQKNTDENIENYSDNEPDKVRIIFIVKDTGIGIKPENMSKLFNEFERIEEMQNRGVVGTGLGMSITIRFLKMMDSELKVDSIYGQGSKFYFELEQTIIKRETISEVKSKQLEKLKTENYQELFVAPKAKILVVDDNKMNLKVFCSILKETKMQIDAVESGVECLQLAKENKYDLIFLDHMMPEMDGVETLHRLKKMEDSKSKDTPVIVLTANAISGAREFYLSEGFDDFISKPFNPEYLERIIKERLPENIINYPEIINDNETNKNEIEINKANDNKVSNIETECFNIKELPEIEGIDWEYGLSHFNNIGETYFDMIKNFYHSMINEADKLKSFYELLIEEIDSVLNSDMTEENIKKLFKKYRIQIHSMKGSLDLLGLVKLAELAKKLEAAAKEGNIEAIKDETLEFLSEWNSYRERLEIIITFEDK